MNKWEVYRLPFPNGRWCAMNRADYWSDRYFDTHAEALKYADERARTVEVIVPRGVQPGCSVQADFENGDLPEWVMLESADGRICTSTHPVYPRWLLDHCALILRFAWITQNAIDHRQVG